jgi:hypothetical protein
MADALNAWSAPRTVPKPSPTYAALRAYVRSRLGGGVPLAVEVKRRARVVCSARGLCRPRWFIRCRSWHQVQLWVC